MKKALYSLLAFATLLFAASCAKEPANVADPALGGKPVTTTFTVNMGGDLTKAAPVNSTLDDGTKVDVLYVGAYKDGALISTSKVDGSVPVTNRKAEVTLTLSKGVEYDLVFFAEVAGKYTVNFADGVATFAYPATVNANDPELDAFYKTMKFTPDGKNMTQEVVLTRPFAQLNVLVPNEKLPQDKTTDYVSTMTVKGVPTSFDLLGESPVAPAADASLTFAGAKIDAASFGNYASTAKWVGMNFILVPEAGTVDLTFNETDMPAPLDLTGIAVKTNGRTNLVGNIYGLGDYTFNVTVDEKFADEGETPIDANEVTYVIDDGQTYTAENPLVLDTDAVKSVSVTINGVDGSQITLSEVNANPVEAGKQVTVSSSDETVAAVALDGDAIKITPKANGDAVITIETPSFTKATYAAAVAKIYVQVTGMAVEPVDPELTVDGVPAEAVSEAFNLTVATNSTGEISWTVAPDGAATVAAGEKAGEYIVTPADNLTEDTPVTVTFTVAAAEGFNVASKEVKFTVKAAETPVEPTETVSLPYEEPFTTGIGKFTTDDVVVEGSDTKVWLQSNSYGMVATSFVKLTGAEAKTNNAADSWLTSPLIDLGEATAPTLSFDHAANYFTSIDTAKEEATVWIKEEGGSWTKLDVNYPASLSFTFVSSGEVSLASYAGKKIQIGFHYTSTATKSGTYEVKNFKVEDASTPIETTASFASESKTVSVGNTVNNALTTNSPGEKTYSSSNTAIATVDANTGVVTGVAEGEATISVAITASGRYTAGNASYIVTVTAASGDTTPDPEMIVFADITPALENGVQYTEPFDGGNFTITFAGGANDGKYYTTGSGIRTYGGGTITIASANYTISKIEFVWDGSNKPDSGDVVDSGSLNDDFTEWTGEASSVVLTRPSGSGHWRLKSVKVTYK